jgi:hypothetical protein
MREIRRQGEGGAGGRCGRGSVHYQVAAPFWLEHQFGYPCVRARGRTRSEGTINTGDWRHYRNQAAANASTP